MVTFEPLEAEDARHRELRRIMARHKATASSSDIGEGRPVKRYLLPDGVDMKALIRDLEEVGFRLLCNEDGEQ